MTLGTEGRPIALGKDSLEKFWNISLPRAMVGGPRQRLFKKKLKFLCRGPAGKPSAKIFLEKNPDNFFAEGQGAGPQQRFFKKN